jgi:hypothetical protein
MRATSTSLLPSLLLAVLLPSLTAQAQDAAAPPAEPAAPAELAAPTEGTPPETTPPEAVPAEATGTEAADGTGTEALAEQGTISVSSTPVGRVFLDGNDLGLTTPIVDLPVAPGTHTLKVVEDGTGRSKEVTFHLDGGSVLNLNLNLPEASADAVAETPSEEPAVEPAAEPAPVVAAEPVDDWTWMTVAGWSSLGVGTLGILAGAVILTSAGDPDAGPLGFGLFGVGAGLVLGGGVLLYLDSELADSTAANAPAGDAPATTSSFLGFFRR